MDLFTELQERGFINQLSNKDEIKHIINNEKITLYLGSDPTADSLHIGHLIPIMMMRIFQKYGHKPIMLIGGATARIGDPSFRDKSRPMMSEETLKKNIEGLRKSYLKFLNFEEDKAIIVDNYDFIKNYSHLDFLNDFGCDFTIPKMLSMESVKKRLEFGMTFLEFNYMTLQAFDFYTLFKDYNCKLQICGADQWGNAICGIELIRKKLQQEAFVLSTSLITDKDGNKIGKSAGNAIWVNEDKTSAFDYYQYFRNIQDDLVIKFLKLYTDLSLDEIEQYENLTGEDLNKAKKILAFKATEICHGFEKAKDAENKAISLFENSGENAPIIEYQTDKKDINIIDLLFDNKILQSKAEIRRMIEQGGVSVDNIKIDSYTESIVLESSCLVKIGKKRFYKIIKK